MDVFNLVLLCCGLFPDRILETLDDNLHLDSYISDDS
jgi:hypothetical protein